MFFENRFTARAEQVVRLAHESASEMGHGYVGSEHLLCGIVKEAGSVATSLMASKGITAQSVEQEIRKTVGVGIPTVLTPDDFTPRSKHIIELSVAIASKEKGLLLEEKVSAKQADEVLFSLIV